MVFYWLFYLPYLGKFDIVGVLKMRNFFKDKKHKYFPWITDFKADHAEIRYESNVNKLTWLQWFWLHPTAYTLLNFGMNIIAIIMFTFLGIYLGIHHKIYILLLPTGFIVYGNTAQLIDRIKKFNMIKHLTFYDLWLREYDEDIFDKAAEEIGIDDKQIEKAKKKLGVNKQDGN